MGSEVNLTLASDAVLTLAPGQTNSGILGLLKTGGGTSTISGSGTAKIAFSHRSSGFPGGYGE